VWEPAGGQYGGSLLFNGTSSYVSVPYHADFDLSAGYTLTAWVKLTSPPAVGQQTIIGKHDSNADEEMWALHATLWNAANPGSTSTLTGTCCWRIDSTENLSTSWQFIATTWSSAAGKAIFVDDTPANATTAAAGTMDVTSDAVIIGMHTDLASPANHIAGSLDNVAIYAGILTDAQIILARDHAYELPGQAAPPGTVITGVSIGGGSVH